MLFELYKNNKNIIEADVKLNLNLYIPCQQRKTSQKKGIVVKPMIFGDFAVKSISLIFNHNRMVILNLYTFAKVIRQIFCILRPFTSKRAKQIAYYRVTRYVLFIRCTGRSSIR